MNDVITNWSLSFFTEPLLECFLIIALCIAARRRRLFNSLRYFDIYLFLLLLVELSGAIYVLAKTHQFHRTFFAAFNEYLDYSFTMIELLVFSRFFGSCLGSEGINKVIHLTSGCFAIFFLVMMIADKKFPYEISSDTQSNVYTVESVILLVYCSIYFRNLFRRPAYPDLWNHPPFWISAGLLFFLACTLPFSILENHIRATYAAMIVPLYSIFYIFYILLVVMIVKGYLCKSAN